MKCPKCRSDVTQFDKRTGKRVDACVNCGAKFIQNREKKIVWSVVWLLVITFVLGFLDFGLIAALIILVPYVGLTFFYINRMEIENRGQ